MSGIAKIQEKRDVVKANFNNPSSSFIGNKEIWLRDGDQIFCTPVASGEEGDPNLDEYYLYTFRSDNRWTHVLKHDEVDASDVPTDIRPSHKFAFWAFVHEVMHDERRVDSWESVQGPGNRTLFKEVVDDFRIVALGFGRGDYVWNQLVEVYEEQGNLNGSVLRIKRTGSGAMDTSYDIKSTPRQLAIPESKGDEIGSLQLIGDYLLERYGGKQASSPQAEKLSVGLGDLF